MPAGDDERQGKREDLFEGFDSFFGPEDEGWPAQQADMPRPEGAPEDPRDAGAVRLEPSETDFDDELLLPDWDSDLEEPEPGTGGQVVSVPAPDERRDLGRAGRGPTGEQGTDTSAFTEAPTGEVGSDDWSRLRGIVADDEDNDAYDGDFPVQEPTDQNDTILGLYDLDDDTDDARLAETDSADKGTAPGAISLEALRQPPAEYTELPSGPALDESASDESAYAELEAEAEQRTDEPEQLSDDLDATGGGSERREVRTVKVGEPETLLGPAWEEPTSHPVASEGVAETSGHGRNMPAAVITGAVLLAAALISIALSKTAFAVVVGIVVLLAQAELYVTMQRRGYQPASALGLVIGGLMLAGAYLRHEPAMLFLTGLALVLSFLWYMAGPPKSRSGIVGHIGATLLGIVYVPLFASFVLVMLAMPWGRAFTLAVLGLTFLYDTAAFVIGSFWGSRPLAPAISPRKSWEGVFGATVVTFAMSIALLPSIAPIEPSVVSAVGLALVVAVFAPLGDLAESALKRDLGVKDMGNVLPGHGGVLDRIDSVLFVAPAVFYFLRLIL